MKKEGQWGVWLLFFATSVASIVLIGKLFRLQVVEGRSYKEKASSQYITPAHHLLNRGTIFMQSKDGKPNPVALITENYTLYISPQALTKADPESLFEEINAIVEIDKESFLESIAKQDDPYEVIKRNLSLEESEKIAELNYIGIGTHPERERSYPAGSLAAQVIGFTSYDGDERVGMYGLERQYEKILVDSSKKSHINIFAEILLNKHLDNENKEEVSDLILTIEPTVQYYLEDLLDEFLKEYSANLAGAIVMDPHTGAIKAMASKPDFDLNDFSSSDPTLFSNPSVSNVYEMGSVIKPLTMAIGLDSGAITTQSIFHDLGYMKANGYTITNVYKGARGDVTMERILLSSMNTGVSWIVSQVGNKRFVDYLRKLGFGSVTGIDLPSESAGLVTNFDSSRDIEYYTASYGQGFAVTPIAATRALAVLANGGRLVQPYVVSEIRHADGKVELPNHQNSIQVIDPKVAEDVTKMLITVTEDGLNRSISTHSIAAKTGTAQIVVGSQSDNYSDSEAFHSFFGYFPAYDPEFIVFLYADRPQGAEFASQTLTDPFFKITNFLIDYYEVKPDR